MASHRSPSHSPSASASPPASRRTHSPAAAAELVDDPHPGASSPASSSPAGFIFMCNGATKPDCYRYRVLGLPRGRLDVVSRIRRGAAVFLYDFDAKHLYGPYLADSHGGLDLVPGAFHGRFPAQVKFKIDGDFMPLPESSLRSAIKENYTKGKFNPELSSTQVEKLKTLFQPITLLPESSPLHDVDNWPPVRGPLPPLTRLAQPPAYGHHPTAYVAPQAAHSIPHESYEPPCSYLPPTAQPTTHSATITGYGYQDGYEACSLPSTYQYVQAPPSCSLYSQSSMPAYFSGPAYSTGPYYTAYPNYLYQLGSVNSQYQQSSYERATYGAGHEMVTTNLQLVRHYGSTPSGLTAAPIRDQGLVNQPQQVVTGITHAAGSGSQGAGLVGDYYACAPATVQAYRVAGAPGYQ